MDAQAQAAETETVELTPLQAALELPAAVADPNATKLIALDQIHELDNERTYLPEKLEELAASLHANGQLEPCVVRPTPDGASHAKPFELVFGYRRLRAARMLHEQGKGFAAIRCELRDYGDAEVIAANITENYQREEPTPLEQARAMQRLISEAGLSKSEVARRLGCDRSHVIHRLKLLDLPQSVQDKLRDGKLTASVAEVIASLPTAESQEKLAALADKHDFTVKKASEWAHDVIAKEQEVANTPEPVLDLGIVRAARVTELKRLPIRADLNDAEILRLALTALLRSGQDYELLDFLREVFGYSQDQLYGYTATLSDSEVTALLREVVLRYWGSPHRYPTLEPALVQALEAPAETAPVAAKPPEQLLPGASSSLDDVFADPVEEEWF